MADAAKRWSLKALDDGGARLYCASEAAGHSEARREAGHAADALFIASVLVVDPALRRVLRLMARRVVAALDGIGHPNGDELLVVSQAAASIRDVIVGCHGAVSS